MEEGGLQAVDISNPSNPRLSLRSWSNQRMKSVVAAQAYDADGTPRKLAFVSIGTEGLGTFDITSPDSLIEQPQEWNGYYTESVHFVPAQVITEQFMLFIADGRRGVAVLFQDLDRPGGTRFIDGTNHRSYTEGHAIAVAYADGYAYIADDQMGVSVVDASDLDPGGSLQFVSNLDTPGEAVDIVTEGGYVFVADSEAGMHVMRIGTDHELELVASLALSGNCQSIALRDGILFVAAKDAGLYVIDVRDPEHPAVAGNISTPYAVGVDIGDDDIVCIADRDDGLIVFRNPELPSDFTPPAGVTETTGWRVPQSYTNCAGPWNRSPIPPGNPRRISRGAPRRPLPARGRASAWRTWRRRRHTTSHSKPATTPGTGPGSRTAPRQR
jgi:hypothetical protein